MNANTFTLLSSYCKKTKRLGNRRQEIKTGAAAVVPLGGLRVGVGELARWCVRPELANRVTV